MGDQPPARTARGAIIERDQWEKEKKTPFFYSSRTQLKLKSQQHRSCLKGCEIDLEKEKEQRQKNAKKTTHSTQPSHTREARGSSLLSTSSPIFYPHPPPLPRSSAAPSLPLSFHVSFSLSHRQARRVFQQHHPLLVARRCPAARFGI
jgi:hypothetical protein